MSKTIEQIEQELDAKIPRSVVEERDGGGGRKLSYLPGHYVIDRLNKIFGPLNWEKEITDIKEVVNKTSRGEFPAYLVKVRLSVNITQSRGESSENKYSSSYVVKEAYGYGCDKSGQNAHELAMKEAVTDALKVAAKDFGMSLGLALYDKEQVNVEDDEPQAAPKPAAIPRALPTPKSDNAPRVEAPAPVAKREPAQEDTSKLKTLIRTELKNAVTLGKITTGQMQDKLLDKFGVMKLDNLDKVQLDQVLVMVKELSKGAE